MKSLKTRFRPHPRPPHSEIFILATMNFPARPKKSLETRSAATQPIEIHHIFPVCEAE
jgi:hypothetical protein